MQGGVHGLPGDSSLVPFSFPFASVASRVCCLVCSEGVQGWVLLSGVFWCGVFDLPLVVVVLSVVSGAGCSWLVCALLVWTWVLGVLSRWLVDPCGVVVALTALCGLLSPFLGFCVVVSVLGPACMAGWELGSWGVLAGAVQGWRVGLSCWLRVVGWLGACLGVDATE